MAKTYKNLIYSTAEYTKSYQGFKGVELNGSNIFSSPSRLAYCKNMYKDYEGDGADVIESIPGFRKILEFGDKINGIYYYKCTDEVDSLLVHVSDALYRCPLYSKDFSDINPEMIGYLCDEKSVGIQYGKYFYLLDTQGLYRVTEDGGLNQISDDNTPPYVPTMYVSGEKYEERNLLTDLFKEEYYIADPGMYYHATEGLKYNIIDPDKHYCSVSGISDTESGAIHIPSYVSIAGEEYKVTEIENYAFKGNSKITSVQISPGVKKIGMFAFYKCSYITSVITPDSLEEIRNGAFTDCSKLNTIYIGAGLKKMGVAVFATCTSLKNVHYALDAENYNAIENISVLAGQTPVYMSRYNNVTLYLPLHENVIDIQNIEIDGDYINCDTVLQKGLFKAVVIDFPSAADATGKRIRITGTLEEKYSEYNGSTVENGVGVRGYEAIASCNIAQVFDGRIFFAGNPLYPNTVFYTEKHETGTDSELYVGEYNYFNDGTGSFPVKSILAVKDMLAVFKSGDDGSGSIFYHSKLETDDEFLGTIYPVSSVHSGTSALGESISFLDDSVFLSSDGISALDRININYDRSVVCRSHNVNYNLLKEDLSEAKLFVWLGYLAVCVNGKIFLADSRATFTHDTGAKEYEWFLIDGVGTYDGDNRVYRYSHEAIGDAIVHPTQAGEKITGVDVYSGYNDKKVYYYTYIDGIKYSADSTDEFEGGDFYPATHFAANDKLLFFASEMGDVCVFNTDKRGVAPDYISSSDEYNEEEYQAQMGNKIHPYFYDFVGHAPEYVLKTAYDNCGIPHLTKSTVKKSLVIKSKSFAPESISCEAVTDNNDARVIGLLPGAETDFGNFNFESAPWYPTRYTSYALNEKEKRWVEKQIILRSSTFRSPISVYSITYRYRIQGRIKNEI